METRERDGIMVRENYEERGRASESSVCTILLANLSVIAIEVSTNNLSIFSNWNILRTIQVNMKT